MKLPVLDTPTFQVKLVSLSEPLKFRPFTVKEEKVFLIAEESGDDRDILNAIRQILQNCCLSDVDVSKLPIFDTELFFLQLRSKSVSNVSNVKYRDLEDNITREFDIELDEIKATIDPNHSTTIALSPTITVSFKYPTIETLMKLESTDKTEIELVIELLAECLDSVYDGDELFPASEYAKEERLEFIDNMSKQNYDVIKEKFVDLMPKLVRTIKYKNSLGNDREIVLEGFRSFFQ
jgi:hypothetical protein